jgi:hypothetical protein
VKVEGGSVVDWFGLCIYATRCVVVCVVGTDQTAADWRSKSIVKKMSGL